MIDYNPEKILPREVPRIVVRNIKKDFSPNVIKESIFLYGSAEGGKSHQAACMMFHDMCCQKTIGSLKYEYVWANVTKLLFQIRQTYGNKELHGEEQRIVESLSKVRFLVLDDLGAEKSTDWSLQTLYLIVNERYENERVTIITSNLSIDDLANKMEDDRLASRIRGMCKTIEVKGKARR